MNILFFTLTFVFTNLLGINNLPKFGNRINKGQIENDKIDEASGVASSTKNVGILWTHNDSGGESRIYAFDTLGNDIGIFNISGIVNRDWEDIAIGPGPINGESYIYIADIGDNNSEYQVKYIYRIIEPTITVNLPNENNVNEVDILSFTYPDGERDAETVMIDPITKDIYIVGKRDSKIRLYRLPFPQSTFNIMEAELATKFQLPNDPEDNKPYNYITSGDIASNGLEILLKSYSTVYYWQREATETIADVLLTSPIELNYTQEPQGEAICWRNNYDNGYYTLSEENVSTSIFPAFLYYYPRITNATTVETELIVDAFNMKQNYPNPFNPSTTISYSIPSSDVISSHQITTEKFSKITSGSLLPRNANSSRFASVNLTVYDVLGREVATLVDEKQSPGNYKIIFDATGLSTGIFIYKLEVDGFSDSKKMVLTK